MHQNNQAGHSVREWEKDHLLNRFQTLSGVGHWKAKHVLSTTSPVPIAFITVKHTLTQTDVKMDEYSNTTQSNIPLNLPYF